MSRETQNLNALAAVIKRLQQEPDFISKLENLLSSKPEPKEKKVYAQSELDVFSEFTQNGREGLNSKLAELNDIQLKNIIREHNLDSKKLAQKWKSHERLVSLILDKVESRVNKGSAFLTFGEESPASE